MASGDGDYVHPETLVSFVLKGIASMEVAHGTDYHDLLIREGSPWVRMDVVPGVTHDGETGLYNSREGTNLVRDILVAECRPRATEP